VSLSVPRVGVVGAGGMGACHARNIAALDGAVLAWVADPDGDKAQALADELGTEWLADAEEALDDCEAVVVASPDRFHAGAVHAALDHSRPILVEKPLTVELADALGIVNREVDLGRRLVQVGFMRVYDPRHVQVRDALGSLGEVHHIRSVHRNTVSTARTVPRILVESVIHDLHTVRWLSGREIEEVTTTTVERDDTVRMVVVLCRLVGGAIATIEFDDAAAGYEVSVEVTAERGNVVAAEPYRATVRAAGSVGATIGADWFAPFLEAYRVEMTDWLASVRSGAARGPSAWDGYAAQAAVVAAAASGQSRRPEAVEMVERPAIYRGARDLARGPTSIEEQR